MVLPAVAALDPQLVVKIARKLLQEPRWLQHHPARAGAARDPGVAVVELVLGAGDSDVEEAALFLEVAALDRAVAGELAFGGADQEHDVVLKALGLVDRRELDALGVGLDLALAGLAVEEHDLGEELRHLRELPGEADEALQFLKA